MKVNGKIVSLENQVDLKTFLEENGYTINHIAVEKNGEIVPKAIYETVLLSDEDVLEVVRFVGGGWWNALYSQ